MIAYDGVNLIDISGPLQSFEEASRALIAARRTPYNLTIASVDGGLIRSGAQMSIMTERLDDLVPGSFDTLIVPGGSVNGAPPRAPEISAWIKANGNQIRRICSVCTGAFILADAQRLDGRRATTHWRWTDELGRRYPAVAVMADAIFVEDRGIWTSAGVTAGIDLTLALIEADHDYRTAIGVAREQVVYLKRAGGQSQYSAPLAMQQAGRGAFGELHAWMAENLAGDLRVERLAVEAGMSHRTFSRAYFAAIGVTPAKTVEKMRLEAACVAITETDFSLKAIANLTGLRDEQNLRRLFQRRHGINPVEYRQRFSANAGA